MEFFQYSRNIHNFLINFSSINFQYFFPNLKKQLKQKKVAKKINKKALKNAKCHKRSTPKKVSEAIKN